MNYQPTKNTKKAPIVKESPIGKSKWADKIGYLLYRIIRVFKKPNPEPNGLFQALCYRIPLERKKHYWNKHGVECVDFDCKGFNLIAGFDKGYVLFRINDGKFAIDKAIRLQIVTPKYLQEVLGVINSMQISLKDKVNKK